MENTATLLGQVASKLDEREEALRGETTMLLTIGCELSGLIGFWLGF